MKESRGKEKNHHFTRPLDRAIAGTILLIVVALAMAAITYSRELVKAETAQTASIGLPVQ